MKTAKPDSAFTPGPWEVRHWGTDSDEWPLARLSIGPGGRSTFAVVISPNFPGPSMEADARLIAAAPDLYEALVHLVAWAAGDIPIGGPLDRKIERALAKARGES